ncbi:MULTISPECIES: GNAT family N-acetyltransferase [Peribacillus]|uniref:Acetyltransferase YjbC n=1 Tax=Peribacillus simplex TaxID=1478 RepID=A0A9W4KWW2_9BACI|nr:GNAT family N-acetyltransferase [Peribacillus simplex]MDR4927185.1 GNAT family N-acetyltransferase [Peribacillus simplex]WHX92467.1 GNAT family N-acetyltransferase [Peribacillus simplex]CAH0189012.1 Putative acetyltransferase YjbC [Peribacillus simplex]
MNWYEKLNQYFPIEEMKSKEHIEVLLEDKQEIYKKDEGPDHVLLYVEGEEFIFVDYLFVSKRSRGQGLGRKLIQKLQKKQKTILLEVEPVQENDDDTFKRLKFYKREGFRHASSISYSRKSLATKEDTPMEILYWPANRSVDEEDVFDFMKEIYSEIHTYKDDDLYGKSYQDVEDVLSLNAGQETDIFKEVQI